MVLDHSWLFLWIEIEHVLHVVIFSAQSASNMKQCQTCSISVRKNAHSCSNTTIKIQGSIVLARKDRQIADVALKCHTLQWKNFCMMHLHVHDYAA